MTLECILLSASLTSAASITAVCITDIKMSVLLKPWERANSLYGEFDFRNIYKLPKDWKKKS